jgi:hypothetical protein
MFTFSGYSWATTVLVKGPSRSTIHETSSALFIKITVQGEGFRPAPDRDITEGREYHVTRVFRSNPDNANAIAAAQRIRRRRKAGARKP